MAVLADLRLEVSASIYTSKASCQASGLGRPKRHAAWAVAFLILDFFPGSFSADATQLAAGESAHGHVKVRSGGQRKSAPSTV